MQDQSLDSIAFYGIPDDCRAIVTDWYAGRIAALDLDGARSVHLPHPRGGGRVLKLKGAGFMGGPVRFGVHHRSGPKAPVFDFDGRMMDDIASGHDGAFSGGTSFQQASTEYRVAQRLHERGYAPIPCLGYGRIEKDGLVSWFSLFEYPPGLSKDMMYPSLPLEKWIALNTEIGPLMVDLAVKHNLIGYCWYSQLPDGQCLIRDLHPFRFADPFNMSQISWVMQLFYALHIRGNTQRLNAPKWASDPGMPPDLHVWQYRCIAPDVTLADHDALREELVIPYMLNPPGEGFSVERLAATLKANPITAGLMAVCPPQFARF